VILSCADLVPSKSVQRVRFHSFLIIGYLTGEDRHLLKLSVVFNIDLEETKDSFDVLCSGCRSQLGGRQIVENEFVALPWYLSKEAIVWKERKVRVHLYSLKNEEIEQFKTFLNNALQSLF